MPVLGAPGDLQTLAARRVRAEDLHAFTLREPVLGGLVLKIVLQIHARLRRRGIAERLDFEVIHEIGGVGAFGFDADEQRSITARRFEIAGNNHPAVRGGVGDPSILIFAALNRHFNVVGFLAFRQFDRGGEFIRLHARQKFGYRQLRAVPVRRSSRNFQAFHAARRLVFGIANFGGSATRPIISSLFKAVFPPSPPTARKSARPKTQGANVNI